MKKIFALLLAMTMICGVAFALEGLTAGAEYRFHDFDAEEASTVMEAKIYVGYEGAFMEEALEVDAELNFLMQNFDDMAMGIDLNLEGRYFMPIGAASKLGFILNSRTYMAFDEEKWIGTEEPQWSATNKLQSWLTPGVKYGQEFGFGNIFLQADIPLLLVDDTWDAMDFIYLNFTLSLMNERDDRNGFGAELVLYNVLDDLWESDFVDSLDITPFWGQGAFYAEVEIGIPLYEDGIKWQGMNVIPKFVMDIAPVNGLSLWLDAPIRGLGAKDFDWMTGDWGDTSDPIIGIGLGVDFKF